MNNLKDLKDCVFNIPVDDVFQSNLIYIDSRFDEILADLMADNCWNGICECRALVERQEERNGFDFPVKGFYERKFKEFLFSMVLGLLYEKSWDGTYPAFWHFIHTDSEGHIVDRFYVYKEQEFKQFLLDHAVLERPVDGRIHKEAVLRFQVDGYLMSGYEKEDTK